MVKRAKLIPKQKSKVEPESSGLKLDADKVNFSMGRKISTGGYENIDIHFSYSSSVKATETLDECMDRVVDYVEEQLVKKHDEIIKEL